MSDCSGVRGTTAILLLPRGITPWRPLEKWSRSLFSVSSSPGFRRWSLDTDAEHVRRSCIRLLVHHALSINYCNWGIPLIPPRPRGEKFCSQAAEGLECINVMSLPPFCVTSHKPNHFTSTPPGHTQPANGLHSFEIGRLLEQSRVFRTKPEQSLPHNPSSPSNIIQLQSRQTYPSRNRDSTTLIPFHADFIGGLSGCSMFLVPRRFNGPVVVFETRCRPPKLRSIEFSTRRWTPPGSSYEVVDGKRQKDHKAIFSYDDVNQLFWFSMTQTGFVPIYEPIKISLSLGFCWSLSRPAWIKSHV